jgi:hypothetical protein
MYRYVRGTYPTLEIIISCMTALFGGCRARSPNGLYFWADGDIGPYIFNEIKLVGPVPRTGIFLFRAKAQLIAPFVFISSSGGQRPVLFG